jgi:hypothetical protein
MLNLVSSKSVIYEHSPIYCYSPHTAIRVLIRYFKGLGINNLDNLFYPTPYI